MIRPKPEQPDSLLRLCSVMVKTQLHHWWIQSTTVLLEQVTALLEYLAVSLSDIGQKVKDGGGAWKW